MAGRRDYFGLQAIIAREITDKQALTYKRRIARLGEALHKELERLYGVGSAADDMAAVKRIVTGARAQQHQVLEVLGDRPTRKGNASKDALRVLSVRICLFWLPDEYLTLRFQGLTPATCDLPLAFATGSPPFRFAKYMYEYLGAPRCTDRMIVKRLRAAALEFTTAPREKCRRYNTFPG